MKWKPITNLPDDWEKLTNQELISLVTVWEEQAGRLRHSGAFKTYMSRLRREIAIETGIIERLYSLDRGVTRLLIEHGIDESLIPHGTRYCQMLWINFHSTYPGGSLERLTNAPILLRSEIVAVHLGT